MEKVGAILLLAVLGTALSLFICYQRMDKKRFFTRLYFNNNLDDHLIDWLRAARALEGTLWTDTGFWEILDRELAAYDRAPSSKPERRVACFNRVLVLFTDLYQRSPDSEAFASAVAPLNELFRSFIDQVDTYNHYARVYNDSLEDGIGSVLTDVFHIKTLDILNDADL